VNTHTFDIDGFAVGGARVFVIAEIGNNHNGSVELARKLVDVAIQVGVDCVKFQLRDREALYRVRADGSVAEDLGVEYIQDLLNKVELTVAQHRELREYCACKGVTYICTPWDEPSVDVLATFDVPAFKIASADLCNPYLIKKTASLGKPLILSTGMSFEHEIVRAIAQLNELKIPFALLNYIMSLAIRVMNVARRSLSLPSRWVRRSSNVTLRSTGIWKAPIIWPALSRKNSGVWSKGFAKLRRRCLGPVQDGMSAKGSC
jgi:sialic acid synthase SpsE